MESDRYDLWANNIAALQDAYLPSSLEYRIREDANAHCIIRKALAYLEESLQLALEIGSDERPNENWDEPAISSSQVDEGIILQSSEIVELYLSIQEAITSLFRLSMIIRKKPEKDEYVKAAARYQIDPTSDVVHVADKYPTAKKDELPWLMKRLGIAITRRRQYLLFRREHQERMLQSYRMRAGLDGNTIWSGTKASTYLPDEQFAIDEEDSAQPTRITIEKSQKLPQTEYADSSRGKDGVTDFLRTPLLPMRDDGSRVQYDKHFECPYCKRLQIIHDKADWKKHVLSDLKPYVCTFQPCELNMFDSQHEWFNHELYFHRKQWRCIYCKHRRPESRPDLETHLSAEHQNVLKEQDIGVVLETCRIGRIDASACPLCEEYGAKFQKINQSFKCDVSLKQFQQHLGSHMEQLALAALPQENHGEGNDNRDGNDNESNETENIKGDMDSETESEVRNKVGEGIEGRAAGEVDDAGDEDEPIHFKDSLGRKFTFPFHLCHTWAGMKELIMVSYLEVTFDVRVADGLYDLLGPDGEIILPQVWETVLKPGWRIAMRMWPLPTAPDTAENSDEHLFVINQQASITYNSPNRQKSKKWVEAKPADYNGGGWGDEDEESPAPPWMSKDADATNEGSYREYVRAQSSQGYSSVPSPSLLPRPQRLSQLSQVPWWPDFGGFSNDQLNKTNITGQYVQNDVSNKADAQWPLDRVLIWLATNQFSSDWQETFKALNLHGNQFLELHSSYGSRGNLGMMHQQVYPRLAMECSRSGTGWDQAREREEGKRMCRLIRGIVTGRSGEQVNSSHM